MNETVAVQFEFLGVEPVLGAGRLLHLANVTVEIAGVEITIQGVQVVRRDDGKLSVRPPGFRHPRTGQQLPGIILPRELRDAIAVGLLELVGAEVQQLRMVGGERGQSRGE